MALILEKLKVALEKTEAIFDLVNQDKVYINPIVLNKED